MEFVTIDDVRAGFAKFMEEPGVQNFHDFINHHATRNFIRKFGALYFTNCSGLADCTVGLKSEVDRPERYIDYCDVKIFALEFFGLEMCEDLPCYHDGKWPCNCST